MTGMGIWNSLLNRWKCFKSWTIWNTITWSSFCKFNRWGSFRLFPNKKV